MKLIWMIFPYIIIGFPTFMAYLEKHYKNRKHIFLKIGLLFLIVVSFFRYGVARDYFSYYNIYHYIAEGGDRFLLSEPLFYYLLKISSDLYLPYNSLLGIISMFYILVFYFFILKKISIRYWYVGMFFFLIINANYFSAMGAMRQSIAVAFFVIAVHYYNKSLIKTILFLLIGAMFHRSMWIIIPILLSMKFFSVRGFYLALMPFVLFLVFPNLLPTLIDSLLNMIGITDAFRSYLYTDRGGFTIRNILKNLLYVVVFLQYLWFLKILSKDPKNIYIKLLLVGLLIHLFVAIGLGIFSRLLSYFYIFYPIVIVMFLQRYKMKNGVIFSIFLFLFIGNHIKQSLLPVEYAKYYAQYQLIIFKSESDMKEDRRSYKAEDRALRMKGVI